METVCFSHNLKNKTKRPAVELHCGRRRSSPGANEEEGGVEFKSDTVRSRVFDEGVVAHQAVVALRQDEGLLQAAQDDFPQILQDPLQHRLLTDVRKDAETEEHTEASVSRCELVLSIQFSLMQKYEQVPSLLENLRPPECIMSLKKANCAIFKHRYLFIF